MSHRARKEASRWLLRLQSDHVGAADRDAFKAWYRAKRENAAAFDGLTETVGRIRFLGERFAVDPLPAPGFVRMPAPQSRRSFLTAAAGGALAAGFVVFAWVAVTAPRTGDSTTFQTALGGQRQVKLADGSQVDLNTDTRIDVTMTAARRQVTLQKGEALFDVEHEPDRPFEVEAGGHVLRAVGTVFSVRVDERENLLVVIEGSVSVTPRDGAPLQLVSASERFDLARGVRTTLLDTKAIERSLAWRRGMLDFEGVALGAIVTEVERYTGAHFTFADPALADLPMATYFRAADLGGFISRLETSYPLLSVRQTESGYLIYQRPEATR